MSRPLLTLLILAAVSFAGCADEAPPEQETDPDDDKFDPIEVSDDKGAIRGLVLDPAIQPVAGVKIIIIGTELIAQSNEEGAFVFSNLDPGAYFLEASKQGYNTTQRDVIVEAGVEKPPIAKFLLPIDVATQPRAITTNWEGFLQCGAGAVGASTNPCFIADSENTHVFDLQGSGHPDWIQVEMVWEGTNTFGDSLGIGIYDPSTTASDFVGNDCGSPCWFRVNGTLMQDKLGEDYTNFLVRVFPGTNDGEGGSVIIEQRFTVYVTEFYHTIPDDDWLYVEDGAHQVVQ